MYSEEDCFLFQSNLQGSSLITIKMHFGRNIWALEFFGEVLVFLGPEKKKRKRKEKEKLSKKKIDALNVSENVILFGNI